MITEQETNLEIKDFLKNKIPELEKKMEEYIPRTATKEWIESALGKTVFELDLAAYNQGVNTPIWDLLDRGGKRFRPILACIVCEAVGGKWEKAMELAPIVELIHNGTLLSDDVEDDSVLRRGKPCIHKIYGVDTAINTGAIMYFWPMIRIVNNDFGLTEEQRLRIYDLYITEMIRVSSGQAWDIEWHHGGYTPNEAQYLNMCLGKTGVLTRFACKLGAIIGGASDEQSRVLGEFGQIIGVGFQIQDDILELTEAGFKEGKGSIAGDITEGKRTLIVIRTIDQATNEDRDKLIQILDSHTTKEEEIREALAIINKYDGVNYAKKRAEELVLGAWDKVSGVLPESNAKIVLKKFAEYLVDRKI